MNRLHSTRYQAGWSLPILSIALCAIALLVWATDWTAVLWLIALGIAIALGYGVREFLNQDLDEEYLLETTPASVFVYSVNTDGDLTIAAQSLSKEFRTPPFERRILGDDEYLYATGKGSLSVVVSREQNKPLTEIKMHYEGLTRPPDNAFETLGQGLANALSMTVTTINDGSVGPNSVAPHAVGRQFKPE